MLYIKIHPLTLSMSRERSHDLQLLSTGSANVLIVVCNLVIDEKDVTIIAMSMTRTNRTNKNILSP